MDMKYIMMSGGEREWTTSQLLTSFDDGLARVLFSVKSFSITQKQTKETLHQTRLKVKINAGSCLLTSTWRHNITQTQKQRHRHMHTIYIYTHTNKLKKK